LKSFQEGEQEKREKKKWRDKPNQGTMYVYMEMA
jgi:hypothetical protein